MLISILDYLLKILLVWNKVFTWFVGVLVTPLTIAFNDGLLDTYGIAFTLITWSIIADFGLGFLNAVFNEKRTVKSKKMGQTMIKLVGSYFIFITLVLFCLVTYQNNSLGFVFLALHPAVVAFTTFTVTRELISLTETSEDMGIPHARRVREFVSYIPKFFQKK